MAAPHFRTRVGDGDPESFGQLLDSCARTVYNHAYRMTGDWTTAEDVVSLTFLEACRLRERITPDVGHAVRGCWASPRRSCAAGAGPPEREVLALYV